MQKFEFINYYRVSRQNNGNVLITFGLGKSFAISIPVKLLMKIVLDNQKSKAS